MQTLDRQSLTYVMFVYRENGDAVCDDPPRLPFTVDDAGARAAIAKSMASRALRYDMYRELMLVSTLSYGAPGTGLEIRHVFNCGDHREWTPEHFVFGGHGFGEPGVAGTRTITETDSEAKLVEAVCAQMFEGLDELDSGEVLGSRKFVGWQLQTSFLPMLVNKAMAYGVRTPRSIRSDPMRKYSTVDVVLDLANLYSQGVGYQIRPLPSLGDVLKYWNPGLDSEFMEAHVIADAVCDGDGKAELEVEKYLLAMKDATERYLTS